MPLDAAQEMLTLGSYNVISLVFHSMPGAGSFLRNAINNVLDVEHLYAAHIEVKVLNKWVRNNYVQSDKHRFGIEILIMYHHEIYSLMTK